MILILLSYIILLSYFDPEIAKKKQLFTTFFELYAHKCVGGDCFFTTFFVVKVFHSKQYNYPSRGTAFILLPIVFQEDKNVYNRGEH